MTDLEILKAMLDRALVRYDLMDSDNEKVIFLRDDWGDDSVLFYFNSSGMLDRVM